MTGGSGFTERVVRADGFEIRYAESGKGPTLVWFHGAGGLRISPGLDLLADSHRVIAFEAPGFGESPVNERSRTMAELGHTMMAAVDALELEHFNLAGTSFGGRLALSLATALSDTGRERLESLVLAAPAAILVGPRVPATPERLWIHPARRPTDGPPPPEIVAKHEALVTRLIDRPRDPELEAAMAELPTPTLVLFGAADEMTPPELGRRYRALMPNCHFVIVHDAGHALDGDRPEAFAAIVADFVAAREQFVVRRESRLLYP